MKCPRCQSELDERDRSGLTIDVCTSCRGVWLDRGELEKLLALAKRELEEERAYYGASAPPRDYDREPPSSDRRRPYPPAQSPSQAYGRPHYKKKNWLDSIGDIFD